MFDVLLRGGRVLDPSSGLDGRADVGIRGGRIAAVGPGLAEPANDVLDAAGLIVTPGLIDLHVHIYAGVSHYGIDADPTCLARGVTTALDAGSAGASTFAGLRRYIIEASATRLFALLNISRVGMVSGAEQDPPLGELEDLRHLNVSAAVRCINANRDKILGVKLRLSDNLAADGRNELPGLKLAREAADAVGLPLMIHTPNSSLPLATILAEMKPGDVLTHCFHEHRCGILDGERKVLPEVRKAIERGVLLDVGHGRGSFTYEIARAALSQGIEPHTISSDLHFYNVNGPVFDLATTLSKFLHLGFSLPDALRKVTTVPARFLKMEQEIGTLAVGACADVAAFRLHETPRAFPDAFDRLETLERWLQPAIVVRGGRVVVRPTVLPA
jgi:dihydroorotase